MIALRQGRLSLGLEPALGGSVAWFRSGDVPILRETSAEAIEIRNGRRFGAFPLIPYSNRIRDGKFSFGGVAYALAHDAQDTRHALHGTSRFAAWTVLAADASSAHLALDYVPVPGDWPFAYRAEQFFRLHEDRLTLRLSIENRHASPAPAGLGLHPYFPRDETTALRFAAAFVWEKDAADIPVRAAPDTGKFDFTAGRAIPPHAPVDNAYGGWDGFAEIAYASHTVTLRADPVFRDIVLYTPEDRTFFAIEPVTHRPDALNPNGADRDDGMTVLAPGGRLSGTIELSVAAT